MAGRGRGVFGWGALGALVAACHAESSPAPCPTGTQPYGELCAPRLDACDDLSSPLVGGGCAPVGVPAGSCGAGFDSDGAGGCVARLPAAACGPGTLAVPGDTTCRPVGVTACGAGFTGEGGGCAPILPATACAAGLVARPGESACHELVECGTDPYGTPPSDAPVLYVDASFSGVGSNGSKSKPFVSLTDAVAAADASKPTTLALAAGTYVESVTVDRPVRIWGRCPASVHLRGTGTTPALRITSAAEIQRIAITGPAGGVEIVDTTVTIQSTRIHDTGGMGVLVTRKDATTTLVAKDVLVERATTTGIELVGATATIEATVVRDTRVRADGAYGRGIHAGWSALAKARAELVLRGSLIERNVEAAVFVLGATATVEATVIRDTAGAGAMALLEEAAEQASTLTLKSTVISGSVDRGVRVVGSRLDASQTTVRETRPRADGKFGQGVYGTSSLLADGRVVRAELSLRDSLVERATSFGVVGFGSLVRVERTLVSKTQPRLDGGGGGGVGILYDPTTRTRGEGTLLSSLVEGNLEQGVLVSGATVRIESSAIRGTRARKVDGLLGIGVVAQNDDVAIAELADLTLVGTLIDDNVTLGVTVLGSKASLTACLIRGTSAGPHGRQGVGVFADSDPRGARARLVMSGCVVDGNTTTGLVVAASDADVDTTVIRATRPQPFDGDFGYGALVAFDADTEQEGTLVLRRSLLERNAGVGLFVSASTASLSSVLVRDTAEGIGPSAGIAAVDEVGKHPAHLALEACVVSQNASVGVIVSGGDASVARSSVRHTRARLADGTYGDGISSIDGHGPSAITVEQTTVVHNARAGVSAFGASAALHHSHVTCNVFGLVAETLNGNTPLFRDDGGVLCGCGESQVTCKAQSSNLTPIEIPRPPRL